MTAGARISLLVGEARRNLQSLRSATIVQASLLVLVGCVVVGVDHHSVSALIDEQATYAQAGGYIYVVSGRVDAGSCRDVGTSSAVRLVGGAAHRPPLVIESQPGRPLPAIEVAGDALSIWAAEHVPPTSVAVGSILRRDLSAATLEALHIANGPTLTVDVILAPDRHEVIGQALIIPGPWAGVFDECWLEFEPITPAVGASIAGLVSAGVEPEIRVLAARAPGAPTPEEGFDGRITQWAWLAGALLTTGLVWLAEFTRRGDVALYLVLGWRRHELTLQRLIEFSMMHHPARLFVAGVWTAAAIIADNSSRFELSVALNNFVLLAAAEWAGAALVMLVMVPRDLVSTLRGA